MRVVDAPIMPNIISGNLNATTIMLAEKIVDKMKGKQLPRSTVDCFTANSAPLRAKLAMTEVENELKAGGLSTSLDIRNPAHIGQDIDEGRDG